MLPSVGARRLRRADSSLSTAYRNATVLSLSRNYLTGSTDALAGAEKLQTL